MPRSMVMRVTSVEWDGAEGAIPVARRLTYSAAGRPSADVTAGNVRAGPDGVQFDARTPWGRGSVGLRLTGNFDLLHQFVR